MAIDASATKKVFMILAGVIALLIVLLIARAVHTLYSVSSYRKSWQTEAKLPIKKDVLVVAALGDSTVQGVGALTRSGSFISQVTGRVSDSLDKDIQVYNFSVSGAESGEAAEVQLPQLKALERVDAVVIAVGPNDLVHQKSLSSFLKSYETILKNVPRDKTVIADLPPMGPKDPQGRDSYLWGQELRKLAKKYDVRVAPIYENIKPRAHDFRTYGGDFFHPSTTGYSLWANAFEKPLTDILKK